MPATNPRINVVMEPLLYQAVAKLAKREGISLSLKVRDLVKEALEFYEDLQLSQLAEAREKTLVKSQAISHKDFWNHLKRKKAA